MKKSISLGLVLAMVLTMAVALTGCGGGNQAKNDGVFTVYGFGNPVDASQEDIAEKYEEIWIEKCEYPVEPIIGDFKMIMASGDYPDIIVSREMDDATVSKYAAQGILIPLDEYITEENTPNIWKMFQETPSAKAVITNPDGHIYSFPSYKGNIVDYVETYWWINDNWLQKLGLKDPTTIDELTEVLRAFKTKDPNGNGKADEIPFAFHNTGSSSFPETLLSCWGVSTKFGTYDSYLNVRDGEVRFTPMMDEWKEMIKVYASWYKEGLLDIECLSQENNAWYSKLAANPPIIGCTFYTAQNPFETAADQYKIILPISADGKIKPQIHLHPGVNGGKNEGHITSACEDPAAAMRWIDTWFSKEATIENWFGLVGENEPFAKIEDGMYKWNDPEKLGYSSIGEMYTNETYSLVARFGYLQWDKDRGTLFEDCEAFQEKDKVYEMYKPYIDFQTWPRPYYAPEDATRIANLQTDIFNIVEENKADWILGRSDVEKDWEKYLKELENIGTNEYMEILQRTYDVYQGVLDELTGK